MPNWCQNHLTGTGATPELRAWLADGFSFHRMNPAPPAEPQHDSAIDSWRTVDTYCNAWRTRCDLDDHVQRQVADEQLETGRSFFDTAWSPPIQAIEANHSRGPNSAWVDSRVKYAMTSGRKYR